MIGPSHQPKAVDPEDGLIYRVMADLVTFKAVAGDTNGAYSLFEIVTEPGAGMLPHRQRYDDETLWVLAGSYTFRLDSREVTLGAGSYVFAPRGTVHGYTNSGAGRARMLIFITPGGIHDRFFTEVGELVDDRQTSNQPTSSPDLFWLRAIAQKYGIEIL